MPDIFSENFFPLPFSPSAEWELPPTDWDFSFFTHVFLPPAHISHRRTGWQYCLSPYFRHTLMGIQSFLLFFFGSPPFFRLLSRASFSFSSSAENIKIPCPLFSDAINKKMLFLLQFPFLLHRLPYLKVPPTQSARPFLKKPPPLFSSFFLP